MATSDQYKPEQTPEKLTQEEMAELGEWWAQLTPEQRMNVVEGLNWDALEQDDTK